MQHILKPLIAGVILLFLTGISGAKEWHGIVPLHSTREDVARVLGSPAEANSFRANYSMEKEEVYIVFSNEEFNQECVRKLPPATVLLIQIRPTRYLLTWPEDRFDMVWVFDRNPSSAEYSFKQIPQNLLMGDLASLMK